MSLSKEYIAQQKMKKQAEADNLARKERQNIVNTIQNDSSQSIPFDTIIYTTLDNTPLSLRADLNGIVSNTYVDGYGVVQFSGPIYTIRKDLFYSCLMLTSITIPECVSSIEADAFHGCTNLQTVNISSLASWCMIDFASAKSTPLYYGATLMLNKQPIEIVHIPQNITTIKDFAFANYESIKEVYIHEYVQYIGRCAFNGCHNLKIVKFDGTTPPKIGGKAFGRNNSERLIYVPSESVERYQYKSGWIELFYHIKGY